MYKSNITASDIYKNVDISLLLPTLSPAVKLLCNPVSELRCRQNGRDSILRSLPLYLPFPTISLKR